jgi:hypothetical protein
MKIFDNYTPQDVPFVCPNCYYLLTKHDILGEGQYPENNFRGMMKKGVIAIGFECSHCFTKSVCHKE